MSKGIISTILLFGVFIGFLWWGISMLATRGNDVETIVYAILILACAGYAFVSLLLLPRRRQR